MLKVKCKEVNVRFCNPNFQQQRIRYTDNTITQFLIFEQDDSQVTILYCREFEGKNLINKILSFNNKDVLEVEIDSTIDAYYCSKL